MRLYFLSVCRPNFCIALFNFKGLISSYCSSISRVNLSAQAYHHDFRVSPRVFGSVLYTPSSYKFMSSSIYLVPLFVLEDEVQFRSPSSH